MTDRWIPSVRLQAEIVDDLNVIFGRGKNLYFELNGCTHHFQWQVGELLFKQKVTCVCRWSGGDVRLVLGDLPPLNVLDETLDPLDWEGIEEGLRTLVFESFLQSTLSSMGVILPGQISVESLSLSGNLPRPSADTHVLPFSITGPFANLIGSLNVQRGTIRRLARLGSRPSPVNDSFIDAIPFPFVIEIGRTECDFSTLSALRRNDIVLIDNGVPLKENNVVLRCHNFYFDAVFDGTHLTLGELMENEMDDQLPIGTVPESVEEIPEEENREESFDEGTAQEGDVPPEPEGEKSLRRTIEEDMEESVEEVPEEPDPEISEDPEVTSSNRSPAGRLPVNLTFDLGTKMFLLAEINSFGPGHTFDLGRGLESPVDIRANGLKIASGELVTINDRLGVRVLSLYDRR
jgi:type III secretion system YscQ/HrcQ family protein